MAIDANNISAERKSSLSASRDELAERSNEELLIAVANFQDREAFELFFQRFAKRVYGLGMKLTGTEQIAKDLVQEVMLTVWQGAAAFNMDRGSAQSWIFSMARNKCIDLLRKVRRTRVEISADDVWPDDLRDGEQTEAAAYVEDNVEFEIDIDRLGRFSKQLPTAQRRAVELVYVEDHTHEEAALALAIPLGTFKSRLRLGLIKLRGMVKD